LQPPLARLRRRGGPSTHQRAARGIQSLVRARKRDGAAQRRGSAVRLPAPAAADRRRRAATATDVPRAAPRITREPAARSKGEREQQPPLALASRGALAGLP